MHEVLYATGNSMKFQQAAATCQPFGLTLTQTHLDIPEIQAETGEPVARDKAAKAYAELGKPVTISDDTWMIPGLKGFPGPYMKHVNDWFTVDDWLRLTRDLTDRSVILRQIVVYQDADGQQVFSVDIPGILLREARGTTPYPHSAIVSFDGGKHTNAEFHERGKSAAANYHNPWHEFAEWYGKRHA
jgi:non-canonical purine NTP pyrophosphatase (RdgB/HAM1 family)